MKIEVMIAEYNICSDTFLWRTLTSKKVMSHIFTLDLIVLDILYYEMFDQQNLGQGKKE